MAESEELNWITIEINLLLQKETYEKPRQRHQWANKDMKALNRNNERAEETKLLSVSS